MDIRPVEVSAPGQPHVKRPINRADIAYETLRDSILSCELKPNARLRLEELRDQFQLEKELKEYEDSLEYMLEEF